MTISEYRECVHFLDECEKQGIDWSEVSEGLWHFGYDTEGNICKIEPSKVVLDILYE